MESSQHLPNKPMYHCSTIQCDLLWTRQCTEYDWPKLYRCLSFFCASTGLYPWCCRCMSVFGTMLMRSTVRQKRFDGYPVIWSLACRLSEWHWATNIKIIKSPKVRLQINTFVSSKIVTCHWTEDKNRLDPNIPKQQSGSRTSHWHAFTKSQNQNKPKESTRGRTEDWPNKSVHDRIW